MYPPPTPMVRALLIINVAVFALIVALPLIFNLPVPWDAQAVNTDMMLRYFTSSEFKAYQLFTHFFHHADIGHIFFNMLMLYFFGPVIEKTVGSNKFLILYFVAAAGAVALHTGEIWWQLNNTPNIQTFSGISPENSRMLGASGAISGIMAAFAVFYPRTKLQFLFIPVPVAAMYMITGIFLLDLFMGVMNFSFDSTARFAHLGGAITGAILAFAWKKNTMPPGVQRWN